MVPEVLICLILLIMKRCFICIRVFILVLVPGISFSQQVFATAGTHMTGLNVQISWTNGEPVIETCTTTSVILTQGFHQSRLTVTAVDPAVYPDLQLRVYPNPVSTDLKLEITGDRLKELSFCLSNLEGKVILKREAETYPELIPMENCAPGAYLLSVYCKANQLLKTFKIVKN